MKESFPMPDRPVSSREEEIQYVGERIVDVDSSPETQKEQITTYQQQPAGQILDSDYTVPEEEVGQISLDLSPEEHDATMQELIALTKEKGIKNALSVVQKMKDGHIEDDFHRFLIEYIREGYEIQGLKTKSPVSKALHMTLFEVVLPPADKEDEGKQLAQLISSMEQFYSGMFSVSDNEGVGQDYFAIEIANPNYHEEFIFYVSVPATKKEFLEKHITAVFPKALVTEERNDYNIFSEGSVEVGSVARFSGDSIFPIRSYESFDRDPLNGLLNSLSKIKKEGEGASFQIIFSSAGANLISKKYRTALENLQKGMSRKEALDISYTVGQELGKEAKKTFTSFFSSNTKPQKEESVEEQKEDNQEIIDLIKTKTSAPLYKANIRLLASSQTEQGARAILSDMESSFNQFENSQGGKFVFDRKTGKHLTNLIHNFSYRIFEESQAIPFNLKELTTIVHFHTAGVGSASQLKKSSSQKIGAPVSVSGEGILLGKNVSRGEEREIRMLPEDRLRHLYTIGQTGTGKSTFLKNMIIQDIQAGEGVCYIDPHGADIQDVLASVPKERHEDVIYFDPSDSERVMGLNMLEYDPARPEQKTFVVNELFSIFQKLYGSVPESMGPMFEQYFRNATMLTIDDPESGSTLLDVSRVLSDKEYREMKLQKCKNPVVVQFWDKVASQAKGESALENIVPYITSKFDVFLANDIMRPIIAQQHSAFDFRTLMDQKKILLVNLSKGSLGDINSNLIGLIFIGKILMAALSRADSHGTDMPPFYLYVDEFQNVTTDSIAIILSEARKYKLSLNVAHQFIAQLQESIKDAVFGNVGSMVSFRVGSEDADFLEKQFQPSFTASDLMNIENRNAAIKMIVNGQPATPFSLTSVPLTQPLTQDTESLKQLSALTFGRSRKEVDVEIMKKYRQR